MFKMIAVKILGAFLFVHVAQAITADYCKPELCTEFDGTNTVVLPHIACKHKGWAAECGITQVQVRITSAHIKMFLDGHNEKRNAIASGSVTGFGPAVRMATVVWSPELATLAEMNTKQCIMEHDKCHNTDEFKYSGQNLYVGGSKPNFPTVESQITASMEKWYSEIKDATQANLDKFGSTTAVIGHFTAMVTAHSTHIGCGVSRYTDSKGWRRTLIACNYAAPNMQDYSIFVKGPAASNCVAKNPLYTSLCAIGEAIDPNAFD